MTQFNFRVAVLVLTLGLGISAAMGGSPWVAMMEAAIFTQVVTDWVWRIRLAHIMDEMHHLQEEIVATHQMIKKES